LLSSQVCRRLEVGRGDGDGECKARLERR
jgi:hypothetical protein